jgi:hypothetical protein
MPRPACLSPPTSLLCKLGSIAVHVQEATGPGGHPFDSTAASVLLDDPEVVAWLAEMDRLALIPRRR